MKRTSSTPDVGVVAANDAQILDIGRSQLRDAMTWPPLLVIARALAYTGVSRSSLNRAVRRGELAVYGRAGGRGARVFEREELDRWLAGPVPNQPPARPPRKAMRRAARSGPPADVDASIARIRTIARGGR